MELLIVTGMSGAGKSRAVNALEDIGFYCVDNLPPRLIPKFAELCMQSQEPIPRVAIVVDIRGGKWFDRLPEILQELKDQCGDYKILFLECDSQVLKRRYKETRRQHPLLAETNGSLSEAIERERAMLHDLRRQTDYLIDTTHLSPAQLKESVVSLFLDNADAGMSITCMSFGFKYGYPEEADLVMDVRCFANPFYVDELRHKTGLDADVRDFVLGHPVTQEFMTKMQSLLTFLIPHYQEEGKHRLSIAIGCTGGAHRSVAICEALAAFLREQGYAISVTHRDLELEQAHWKERPEVQ